MRIPRGVAQSQQNKHTENKTMKKPWVLALLERMRAEDFKQKTVEIIVSVIKAPFGFFEVENEVFVTDTAQLREAQFGETPEGFNTIDVVLAAGELVSVMMDAVVFVAAQDKAVVGLPSVGVDGRLRKHLSLHNRHQLLSGAVLDDGGEDLSSALEQADDRGLAAGSASTFSTHPSCAEVAFVHFHLARKRPRFLHRQLQNPQSELVVKTLRRLHAQPGESRAGKRRNVRTKQLQYRPKFPLRNVRVMNVSVFQ